MWAKLKTPISSLICPMVLVFSILSTVTILRNLNLEHGSNSRTYSSLSKNQSFLQLFFSIRGHLRKSPLDEQHRLDSFLVWVPEPWWGHAGLDAAWFHDSPLVKHLPWLFCDTADQAISTLHHTGSRRSPHSQSQQRTPLRARVWLPRGLLCSSVWQSSQICSLFVASLPSSLEDTSSLFPSPPLCCFHLGGMTSNTVEDMSCTPKKVIAFLLYLIPNFNLCLQILSF